MGLEMNLISMFALLHGFTFFKSIWKALIYRISIITYRPYFIKNGWLLDFLEPF